MKKMNVAVELVLDEVREDDERTGVRWSAEADDDYLVDIPVATAREAMEELQCLGADVTLAFRFSERFERIAREIWLSGTQIVLNYDPDHGGWVAMVEPSEQFGDGLVNTVTSSFHMTPLGALCELRRRM